MIELRRGLGVALTAILLVTLQACGGVDIEQARQLAAAGVASSDKMHGEARVVASSAAAWQEGRVFYAVLVRGDRDLTLAPDRDSVELTKLLKARAAALGAQSAAYKSFQELAVYDAAKTTETATASFIAETNQFLATAKRLDGDAGAAAKQIVPLNPQVTEGISIASGVIAREEQRAKLKKTSVALRFGVEKMAEVLKAERIYAISIRKSIAEDREALRRMARRRGIGSYEQPAKALLSEFNIDAVKDLDGAILRSPQASAAVGRILSDRFHSELETIGPTYDGLIKLLDELVKQHKELEAGRRISLEAIISLARELEGYYQRVHGAGSSPTGT